MNFHTTFTTPQLKSACPHCGENKPLQFYQKNYNAQLGISSKYHKMECWRYKTSLFNRSKKKENFVIDYAEYYCHTCGMTWQQQHYSDSSTDNETYYNNERNE